MLALGRPPEVRYRATGSVTPRLQRLLDAMLTSPAIIKTATWDVWHGTGRQPLCSPTTQRCRQASATSCGSSSANDRVRGSQEDWESTARFVVSAFRADAARAGAVSEVSQLVAELSSSSPEVAALWDGNDVRFHGEGAKRLRHPVLGPIDLEYSSFAVDGRPDVGMIVYNPVEPAITERIRALLTS